MTRCLRKLVLFLLMGAIVNVAVAWGSTILQKPLGPVPGAIPMGYPLSQSDEQALARVGWKPLPDRDQCTRYDFWSFIDEYHGCFVRDIQEREITVPGCPQPRNTFSSIQPFPHSDVFAIRIIAGWPVQSLQGMVWLPRASPTFDSLGSTTRLHGALRLHGNQLNGDLMFVPLLPIWSGFAFNTALYSILLLVMAGASATLFRWRRSKRGLCPACAYPIGSSETCTECGAPLKPASPAA